MLHNIIYYRTVDSSQLSGYVEYFEKPLCDAVV